MMDATLIHRCHCGDTYAVVCPSCSESPRAELCPAGTLDALRALLTAHDTAGATRHAAIAMTLEAARAILDAAGE